jgi:predicted adenine nucleotide alpha hydrolase (AANH) superfamily ATPase
MRVLFHACCGPCFVAVGPMLAAEGHEVVGFFYNPNVMPTVEHRAREAAFRQACEAGRIEPVVDPTYEPEGWLRGALDADPRCEYCYRDRLGRCARRAAEGGFDAFTSSILVSPYQRHDLARRVGEEAADEEGVEFLYQDLRPHWKESRRRTFELGLYRQRYCGCILSEHERHLEPRKEGASRCGGGARASGDGDGERSEG